MRYQILLTVNASEDWDQCEVSIATDTDRHLDFRAMIPATEHMMKCVATQSAAGFDRAIELLVEGAKAGKLTEFAGKKLQ